MVELIAHLGLREQPARVAAAHYGDVPLARLRTGVADGTPFRVSKGIPGQFRHARNLCGNTDDAPRADRSRVGKGHLAARIVAQAVCWGQFWVRQQTRRQYSSKPSRPPAQAPPRTSQLLNPFFAFATLPDKPRPPADSRCRFPAIAEVLGNVFLPLSGCSHRQTGVDLHPIHPSHHPIPTFRPHLTPPDTLESELLWTRHFGATIPTVSSRTAAAAIELLDDTSHGRPRNEPSATPRLSQLSLESTWPLRARSYIKRRRLAPPRIARPSEQPDVTEGQNLAEGATIHRRLRRPADLLPK